MANGPIAKMRQAQQNWRQNAGSFNERLEGLLSGASPVGNLGLGLLAASGPSAQPRSFGQVLAQGSQFASERQRAAMETQAMRDALAQQKRQQGAQEQLAGLLGSGEPIDESQLMGLLGQANPQGMAQGMTQALLGQMFPHQERAEPEFVRSIRAAGMDPASGEGQQMLLDHLRNRGADNQLLQMIQTQMAAFQLEEARRKREQEERSERQQRAGLERSVRRNISQVSKLADLNRNLEGTFLQAGVPASELRRTSASAFNALLEGMGMDRTEQRQLVADFDTFRKGLNDLIIENIDRFGDRITDSKLRLLESASANVDIAPDAIASILADILEITLETAEEEGFSIDRGAVESLIDRERNYRFSGQSRQELPGGVTLEWVD